MYKILKYLNVGMGPFDLKLNYDSLNHLDILVMLAMFRKTISFIYFQMHGVNNLGMN